MPQYTVDLSKLTDDLKCVIYAVASFYHVPSAEATPINWAQLIQDVIAAAPYLIAILEAFGVVTVAPTPAS